MLQKFLYGRQINRVRWKGDFVLARFVYPVVPGSNIHWVSLSPAEYRQALAVGCTAEKASGNGCAENADVQVA